MPTYPEQKQQIGSSTSLAMDIPNQLVYAFLGLIAVLVVLLLILWLVHLLKEKRRGHERGQPLIGVV